MAASVRSTIIGIQPFSRRRLNALRTDERSAAVSPANLMLDAFGPGQRVVGLVAIGHQEALETRDEFNMNVTASTVVVVVDDTGLSGGPPVCTHM